MWWCKPLMPAHRRCKQVDLFDSRPGWPSEFQDNQGYVERPKTTTKRLKDLMIGPGSGNFRHFPRYHLLYTSFYLHFVIRHCLCNHCVRLAKTRTVTFPHNPLHPPTVPHSTRHIMNGTPSVLLTYKFLQALVLVCKN